MTVSALRVMMYAEVDYLQLDAAGPFAKRVANPALIHRLAVEATKQLQRQLADQMATKARTTDLSSTPILDRLSGLAASRELWGAEVERASGFSLAATAVVWLSSECGRSARRASRACHCPGGSLIAKRSNALQAASTLLESIPAAEAFLRRRRLEGSKSATRICAAARGKCQRMRTQLWLENQFEHCHSAWVDKGEDVRQAEAKRDKYPAKLQPQRVKRPLLLRRPASASTLARRRAATKRRHRERLSRDAATRDNALARDRRRDKDLLCLEQLGQLIRAIDAAFAIVCPTPAPSSSGVTTSDPPQEDGTLDEDRQQQRQREYEIVFRRYVDKSKDLIKKDVLSMAVKDILPDADAPFKTPFETLDVDQFCELMRDLEDVEDQRMRLVKKSAQRDASLPKAEAIWLSKRASPLPLFLDSLFLDASFRDILHQANNIKGEVAQVAPPWSEPVKTCFDDDYEEETGIRGVHCSSGGNADSNDGANEVLKKFIQAARTASSWCEARNALALLLASRQALGVLDRAEKSSSSYFPVPLMVTEAPQRPLIEHTTRLICIVSCEKGIIIAASSVDAALVATPEDAAAMANSLFELFERNSECWMRVGNNFRQGCGAQDKRIPHFLVFAPSESQVAALGYTQLDAPPIDPTPLPDVDMLSIHVDKSVNRLIVFEVAAFTCHDRDDFIDTGLFDFEELLGLKHSAPPKQPPPGLVCVSLSRPSDQPRFEYRTRIEPRPDIQRVASAMFQPPQPSTSRASALFDYRTRDRALHSARLFQSSPPSVQP